MSYQIATLPGDGIGPEIIEEAVKTLDALNGTLPELDLQMKYLEAGVGLYQRTGVALPESTLREAKEMDAILLGAMGLFTIEGVVVV